MNIELPKTKQMSFGHVQTWHALQLSAQCFHLKLTTITNLEGHSIPGELARHERRKKLTPALHGMMCKPSVISKYHGQGQRKLQWIAPWLKVTEVTEKHDQCTSQVSLVGFGHPSEAGATPNARCVRQTIHSNQPTRAIVELPLISLFFCAVGMGGAKQAAEHQNQCSVLTMI